MPKPITKHRKKLIRAGVGRRPVAPLHPDLLAASYANKLENEIQRGLELVKKHLFPVLLTLDALTRADTAEDQDKINEVLSGILKRYFGGTFTGGNPNLTTYAKEVSKKLVQPMQKQADRFNETQFTKQFKRISGVNPLQFAPGLSDALEVAGEQNVNKIVSVSSKYFDDIKEMTNNALRKGTSVKELTEDIRILTGSTQTQSKLIAIDQVQKLNADLERTRQQANHVKRYIWRTRKNARVRSKGNSSGYSDHAGLEGAVFDWSFPPITVLKGKRAGERNHPGNDINCKCTSEPVLEDILGETSRALEAAELKTRKLISAGRVPGYTLPKRTKTEAA